ncbi:putative holin [Pseudomonas peli]|uniref:putative holin n=1 Tax=Pseudomonas peli TaxID=592361 RepID=UPI00285F8CDE|nr:putative holin [Pseudomonas peli]MDR7024374.1 membrane protein implicated in regulation of membrane protease activity [Pseudomonas peli]
MSKSCTPSLRLPRMWLWTLITAALLLALLFIRPEQLQVVVYKLLLVTLAAVVAYWVDRSLFPYAQDRPHNCIGGIHIVGAWLRRALIVLACILGMTLGL